MDELISNAKFVIVPVHEYDIVLEKPMYFDCKDKTTIVLFDEYEKCKNWLNNESVPEDIHVGDLYDKNVNNFFTTLFFKKRSLANNLYVFPTISQLGIQLCKETDLDDNVVYAREDGFLRMLSCFGKEEDILENTRKLLTFVVGTGGNYDNDKDPATMLLRDFVRTTFDSVLKIKINNYHKMGLLFPTKKTKAELFYSVMEFEGNLNTGSHIGSTHNACLFFLNKYDAKKYKNSCKSDNIHVVGIDNCYWKVLRKQLILAKIGASICVDSDKNSAIRFEVENFEKFMSLQFGTKFNIE